MIDLFQRLSKQSLLRRLLLPFFARCNPGDIRIRHHYTNDSFLLHSFQHKGYWFHGRRRERDTMEFFDNAISVGNHVVEIGGHIGYMTRYLASLVGEQGQVTVFEPGSNNLPYLRANMHGLKSVRIVEKAVADKDGTARFFEEELTGQNNSLSADYQMFAANRKNAFASSEYRQREVGTLRLDTYMSQEVPQADLMKIDVEGSELIVLQGACQTIAAQLPVLVVEVTCEKQEVYQLLTNLGYLLFNDSGSLLGSHSQIGLNVCALHAEKHAEIIDRCGWRKLASA
jgi:FkbM family methyltransferase